jgi:hypothetical protein
LSLLPGQSVVEGIESFDKRKRRLSCAVQGWGEDTDGGSGKDGQGEDSAEPIATHRNGVRDRKRSSTLSSIGKEDAETIPRAPTQQPPKKRTRKRRALTKPR